MFKIGDIVRVKDHDSTRNHDKVKLRIGETAEITDIIYPPFINPKSPFFTLSIDNIYAYAEEVLEMVKPAAELLLSDKDIDEVMYEI